MTGGSSSRPRAGAFPARAAAALAGLLAAAVLLLYAPVSTFEFTGLDDNEYVTENAHVRSGLNGPSVAWAWTAYHSGHWHPLTWLSLMLDCQLYGVEAGALHLGNAILHALGAALLFLALLRATGDLWPSLFAAALFALHPLRVESVAWVAARKDVLSGLFLMATLWAYAGYARRESVARYAAVLLAFGLGLLAKPTLAVLPCGLLLLDYWPLRRTTLPLETDVPAGLPRARSAAWLVAEKLPLLALSLLTLTQTFAAQGAAGAVAVSENLTLPVRAGNALWNYAAYLGRSFWPFDLAVFYPLKPVPASMVVLSALGLAAVTLAAWRLRRSRPWWLVGWLWFAGTLVPVSGLVQFGGQSMADRYAYLPHIGLVLALTWELAELVRRRNLPRAAVAAVAVVLLAASAARSSSQLGYWRDSVTLFEHALSVTTGNYLIHNNLGTVLEARGDKEGASRHYLEAARINPTWPEALNNAGIAHAWRGDLVRAREHFAAALRIRPAFARAENNMGTALAMQGDHDAAIEHYQRAVQLDPGYVDAHYGLADALEKRGRHGEAVEHYAVVVAARPDWPAAVQRMERARAAASEP